METLCNDNVYKLVRLTCSCLDPAHCVDLEIDKDKQDEFISLSFTERDFSRLTSFSSRLKDAIKMIRGKEVCLKEVILKETDIDPLIALLQEAKTEYNKLK